MSRRKTQGSSKSWQDKIAQRNWVGGVKPKALVKKPEWKVQEEKRFQQERVSKFFDKGSAENTELSIEWYLIKLNQILITTAKDNKYYSFLKSLKDQGERFGRFSDKQKQIILKWNITL